MKYTDKQLQTALVAALPDRLEIYPLTTGAKWKAESASKTGYLVTPHEWSAIVQMVEDGLVENGNYNSTEYAVAISQQQMHDPKHFYPTWQQRTQALVSIGILTVKGGA